MESVRQKCFSRAYDALMQKHNTFQPVHSKVGLTKLENSILQMDLVCKLTGKKKEKTSEWTEERGQDNKLANIRPQTFF